MGKRRIRNLQAVGVGEIIGFDFREDRRKEAQERYGIKIASSVEEGMQENPDALIISTPPNKHSEYIALAIEQKKPVFVEASVVLEGLDVLEKQARERNVLIAPSCTFRFHAAIRDIKQIVQERKYGKVTNFSYHCGQYLPDWHPWEKVTDYYVGNKETGGAKEIVPFELTWLVDILGFPKEVKAFHGKTMDVGADIDDTYAVALRFEEGYGTMVVDVVSRHSIRSLVLNMEKGQILWKWDEQVLKLYDAPNQKWIHYQYPKGQTIEGYNKNIAEEMYIAEMKTFLEAVQGKGEFPNSLGDDIAILTILQQIENQT